MMFDLCVSSGYGKFRLAHFLNDHGIRNRKGETWHDATIGAILHNPLYKGVLRSGETYSEPFEEIQIIKRCRSAPTQNSGPAPRMALRMSAALYQAGCTLHKQ